MSNSRIGLAALSGAAIAAAAALATPTILRWEGTSLDPYKDMVGISTVCAGETRVQMRRYTPAECTALLNKAVTGDFAPTVLKVVPGLKDRPYQFAAAISLTYNIGQAAFARSTVAKRFNAGNWRGGCDAFLSWRFAGGREVAGLLNRRRDERKLCLTGL